MSAARAVPPQGPLISWRRVVESLIVGGLIWLIQAVYAQNNTLVALSAHFDDTAREAAQVPSIQEAVGRLDTSMINSERRISALEAQRAQR